MDTPQFGMQGVLKKRLLVPILLFAFFSAAYALSWRCPNCKKTFRFDSRHAAHMKTFSQQHSAVCKPPQGPRRADGAPRAKGTPFSGHPPKAKAQPHNDPNVVDMRGLPIGIPVVPPGPKSTRPTLKGIPVPTPYLGPNPMLAPAAAELVAMLNRVSKKLRLQKGVDPKDLKGLNCNFFFQGLGRELKAKGRPASGPAWQEGLLANDIGDKIARNESGQWKQVAEAEVQKLANRGVVVVGLSWDRRPGRHGHVAIAFPVPHGGGNVTDGAGPFVRDGNERRARSTTEPGKKKVYPSDWGAVRASKAFKYDRKKHQIRGKWYKWSPSERGAS